MKDSVELESSTVRQHWCLAFSIAKGILDIVIRSLDSPQTFSRKISAMWSDFLIFTEKHFIYALRHSYRHNISVHLSKRVILFCLKNGQSLLITVH